MKLTLNLTCYTDGDFSFRDGEKLLDVNASLYKGAKLKYSYDFENYYIYINLEAEGEENPCRWAARDLMENLVCNIRTHKYHLVKDLYDLIIYPKENFLWSKENIDFSDYLSGNYDGTEIELTIEH